MFPEEKYSRVCTKKKSGGVGEKTVGETLENDNGGQDPRPRGGEKTHLGGSFHKANEKTEGRA